MNFHVSRLEEVLSTYKSKSNPLRCLRYYDRFHILLNTSLQIVVSFDLYSMGAPNKLPYFTVLQKKNSSRIFRYCIPLKVGQNNTAQQVSLSPFNPAICRRLLRQQNPLNPFSLPPTQGRRRVSCLLLASWIDATAPHNHNRHQLGIRTRDTRINNHQPSSSSTSRTCVSFQHGMVPQTEGLGPWRCWMLGLDHGDRILLSLSLSIVVASLRCALIIRIEL